MINAKIISGYYDDEKITGMEHLEQRLEEIKAEKLRIKIQKEKNASLPLTLQLKALAASPSL
jgi:hypothetical protein